MVRMGSSVRFRSLALDHFVFMRRWQSGQLHQTVNLTPSGYGGSNPSLRTNIKLSDFCPTDSAARSAERDGNTGPPPPPPRRPPPGGKPHPPFFIVFLSFN